MVSWQKNTIWLPHAWVFWPIWSIFHFARLASTMVVHQICISNIQYNSYLLAIISFKGKNISKLIRDERIEPYYCCMMHSSSHGCTTSCLMHRFEPHCDAWCTSSGHKLMPAQHCAILRHNNAWCIALTHIEPYWCLISLQKTEWVVLTKLWSLYYSSTWNYYPSAGITKGRKLCGCNLCLWPWCM